MIKKLISGGQPGAARAALDVAIKLDIPHGGWIPKGRQTEDGILQNKYKLQEIRSGGHPNYTEKNVLDSNGTLIVSHGKLKGGAALPRKMADKHRRPRFHIDLNETSDYDAACSIAAWVKQNTIETLNVAGSRASKDPRIYQDTYTILIGAIWTAFAKPYMSGYMYGNVPITELIKQLTIKPWTVNGAVEQLMVDMTFRDKARIANMSKDKLSQYHYSSGLYIRKHLNLRENYRLLEACRAVAGQNEINPRNASYIILKKLWKKLQQTHGLRIIK
jgi:hypothetical protein